MSRDTKLYAILTRLHDSAHYVQNKLMPCYFFPSQPSKNRNWFRAVPGGSGQVPPFTYTHYTLVIDLIGQLRCDVIGSLSVKP